MEVIITSVIAFASTNIDDIFVLMLFFGNKKYNAKHVVIGQYLGIGTLIAISFAGSFVGLVIDKTYIGLLGLLPIFLGIKSLVAYYKKKKISDIEDKEAIVSEHKGSVFSVAGVTIANGGDNIGIYIPLFATLTISGKLVMITIFLIMVAIWCYAGLYLSKHPAIASIIDKYGHIFTPIVLILLGVYILYESGSLGLLST
jgi:cadmium resistance transport/sequestration family protein